MTLGAFPFGESPIGTYDAVEVLLALVVDDPVDVYPGDGILLGYTVTGGVDPVTVQAWIRDRYSIETPMTVSMLDSQISFQVPADWIPDIYTIVVTATDASGNFVTVSKLINVLALFAEVPGIGGDRPGNVISLRKKPQEPEEQGQETPVETIVSCVVWCVRKFEFATPVAMHALRAVEFAVEFRIACEKEFEMVLPVVRESALHFAQILHEDEELLLF